VRCPAAPKTRTAERLPDNRAFHHCAVQTHRKPAATMTKIQVLPGPTGNKDAVDTLSVDDPIRGGRSPFVAVPGVSPGR